MINRIARRALHRLAARAHQKAANTPHRLDLTTRYLREDAQARTDAAWTASCDPEFADAAEDSDLAGFAHDLAIEQSATEEANVAAEEGDHRTAASWHRAAARAA